MKLLIDTNILISAGLFPNSVPDKALQKALLPPHIAFICDYSLDEMARVVRRKFPQKEKDLEIFLYKILLTANLIHTPTEEAENEAKIRDIKDRPIFRASLEAGVNAILTGDKDFLEVDVAQPEMLTAAKFLTK
jgi:putative PIN family toxin of toxin-antitoxin system